MQTLKLQQLRNAIPNPDINPGKMSGFNGHGIYPDGHPSAELAEREPTNIRAGDDSRDDP